MNNRKFVFYFLSNEYQLSRYKNAAFSAIVVGACIIISHFFEMGLLAGAFIVAAQSVTGVNSQGPFRVRLGVALKTAAILSGSAFLGIIAGGEYFAITIVTAIILAFSFAWWRQLFPLNWPDIVIPSGVLFFFNFQENGLLLTVLGTLTGVVFELLLGFAVYFKRNYKQNPDSFISERLSPVPENPDKMVWGLKEYLVLYGIELSILLIIGFILIRYTSYPHIYWIPLTAIIVLKVGRRETLKRVVQRTLGTIIGCLLGSGLIYLHLNIFVASAAMVTCIFFWLCFLRLKYELGTVFITTFVLLLMGSHLQDPFSIVAERIVFTILGGLLALISSVIFLKKERL